MDFFDIEGFVDDRSGMPKSFSLLYENRIKLNGKICLFDTKSLAYRYQRHQGMLMLSGFLGDYEILVRDGDQIKRAYSLGEDAI